MYPIWYKEETLGTQVTEETQVTTASNHMLYAKWEANTYTVTLNNQSATNVGTTTVTTTYGSAMPSITMPTKTGYTFGGYYTLTGGNGTQYYNADGSSTRNWDKNTATTLYAKWEANTYAVTLNNQSATSAGTTSVTVTYGSAMPSITIPTKTGYIFGGYYTSTDSSGIQYYKADGSSTKKWDKTVATTLYAKWLSATTSFAYTGGVQTYTASSTGIYKLEVWGAGGGGGQGGAGGYSSGYIQLAAGETLYIVVGGKGQRPIGGYNGGGNATSDTSVTYRGSGGGGATHIARISGTLSSIGSANASQVLLVAGGGGGFGCWAINATQITTRNGGVGGGTSGGDGQDASNGATLTTGNAFGQGGGGTTSGGGGGGGFYGGYSNNAKAGGGGGSGYIGGVPQFTFEGTTYSPYTNAGSGSAAATDGRATISFVKVIDNVDNQQTQWNYLYTGNVQTFQAPKTGVYKLETLGAGGGNTGSAGGAGGYSSGYLRLNAGETLYVVVGGPGNRPLGGYNGGGNATSDTSVTYRGSGGGGATHIARVNGTLSSIGSGNLSNVLLVAGGGGGAACWATSATETTSRCGGIGGGTTGGSGQDASNTATLTTGNAFGQGGGGTTSGGGGGGGLYGGYSNTYTGGGGGSGYIGGLPQFTYNGVVYSSTTISGNGAASAANGSAVISFITE